LIISEIGLDLGERIPSTLNYLKKRLNLKVLRHKSCTNTIQASPK